MAELRGHQTVLRDGEFVLRPMTEADWDFILHLNNDREVGALSDAQWHVYTLEEVQRIYRGISERAFCFVMEVDGRAIGECWLQEMNLPRIHDRFPGLDCRRIDLTIADKSLWGHGYGSRAIRLLVDFGFREQQANALFACDVASDNSRSRRAFENVGFRVIDAAEWPEGLPGRPTCDLALFRS